MFWGLAIISVLIARMCLNNNLIKLIDIRGSWPISCGKCMLFQKKNLVLDSYNYLSWQRKDCDPGIGIANC